MVSLLNIARVLVFAAVGQVPPEPTPPPSTSSDLYWLAPNQCGAFSAFHLLRLAGGNASQRRGGAKRTAHSSTRSVESELSRRCVARRALRSPTL